MQTMLQDFLGNRGGMPPLMPKLSCHIYMLQIYYYFTSNIVHAIMWYS